MRKVHPLAAGTQHGSRSCELPGLSDEAREDIVGDLWEFYADPAFDANIGWFEVDFGGISDHCGLGAGWSWNPDSGVAVAMVVVGEHDECPFGDKEGRLAVRELL